jgi:23S rRNA pseudouridine1911/1915/1917 synthase
MFAEGEVHKTYWAIVEGGKWKEESGRRKEERGKWKEDRPKGKEDSGEWQMLENWLTRNEQQNKSYAYDHEVPHSKKAQLRYRVLAIGERYALLEVQLMTGRHHQIRCQLAAMGCPIKGDLKYGAKRSNPDGSISLQSHRISFIHPVSKAPIDIEAPLPPDPLWGQLQSLIDN